MAAINPQMNHINECHMNYSQSMNFAPISVKNANE